MPDPTQLAIDSKERVALDLMLAIRNNDPKYQEAAAVGKSAAYQAHVYAACRQLVIGANAQAVLPLLDQRLDAR